MSLADNTYINMCKEILEHGTSTEGQEVRPIWKDTGEKAYTIKSFGICNKYKHYIEVHGYHRKVDFFSEKLGYMIGFPSDQNTLIFNSKLLTKEQKKYLDLFQVKYKTKIEDCYRNKFIK